MGGGFGLAAGDCLGLPRATPTSASPLPLLVRGRLPGSLGLAPQTISRFFRYSGYGRMLLSPLRCEPSAPDRWFLGLLAPLQAILGLPLLRTNYPALVGAVAVPLGFVPRALSLTVVVSSPTPSLSWVLI